MPGQPRYVITVFSYTRYPRVRNDRLGAHGRGNRTAVRSKAGVAIEAVYQAKQTKRLFEMTPAAHYP